MVQTEIKGKVAAAFNDEIEEFIYQQLLKLSIVNQIEMLQTQLAYLTE
jgi:hypothetical protein